MAESNRSRDPPTGINERSQASVSRVAFRTVAKSLADNGSFVGVQHREVTFVGEDTYGAELPSGSRISLSGQDSTLPMAFDNNRFFDGDDGYQELLNQASAAMQALAQSGDAWREPRKEMGFFGYFWRWFVKLFMWFTNDSVNRLRYTRGVQDSLPFQAGYESFALGGVVRAFDVDDRASDNFNLSLCFKNRNASRVLVQNLSRWDYFWHTGTAVTWARMFDLFGNVPFIGFTAFPATENFPSSQNLVLASIFRSFGTGSWLTRFITGQQEGVVTFDVNTAAQNLAAEANSFEQANRNQYGAWIGREKSNIFRIEHRLTIDESIIRTFITSPASTMINNGVEHVLLCLSKHWRNMLYQENGNFAHQRMEQLNPFETLRFHMPSVLSTMANLRGRNVWDMTTMGPFIRRLQHLNPDKIKRRANNKNDEEGGDEEFAAEIHGPCLAAQHLVKELKEKIMPNVCGGVYSRTEPFGRWLDAIYDSLTELAREAEAVKEFVASVDTGIKLGYELLKLVDWRVPTEQRMSQAILDFILDKTTVYPDVPREVINTALQKLPPKDERTLKELIKQNLGDVEAAKLLLVRTGTLLERELRRKALDDRIRELSKGPATTYDTLERNKWYWVGTAIGPRVVVFKGALDNRIKVVDVETPDVVQLLEGAGLSIQQYIPVAEAISRAQKAFMIIEIDYGKKFLYNAFMEFGSTTSSSSLRTRLRRLATLSQVHCSSLDLARMNVLAEIKNSVQKIRKSPKFLASRLVPECKPQNTTVLGGGPTGLLGAIHCLHNVILSGGEVKVYEARDAFSQDAAAFERAQIVRLDARQISMIRYHLGTGYEDVYIPAKGETDAHHGNVLASQGFVEVTIKKLESMILDEMINLRSKGLIHFYSDSKVEYDVLAGIFEKQGKSLKIEDRIFGDGKDPEVMEVVDFVYPSQVPADALVAGQDYDIALPREKKVRSFRLVQMDRRFDWYQFSPHEPGVREVSGSFNALPPIYVNGHGSIDPAVIVVAVNGSKRELSFKTNKDKKFRLDFSATHVVVGIGKPEGSPSHFYVTNAEPYAVCCIEGIKISMGMHNFGVKRWGTGLIDDIRSHSDQNTRIIGDFTKSVTLVPIVERMRRKLSKDAIWKVHLDQLAESVGDKAPSLHTFLLGEIEPLCSTAFRRERLQTRFFELGNNYYLGMEFPREYDLWKTVTIPKVAPNKPETAPDSAKTIRKTFQRTLANHIDRLWYEATLEIIAEGDVYNPGGKGKIPPLYTIDSPFEQRLGELKERDAFRLFTKKYRVHKHDGNGFTQIQSDVERDTFSIPTKTYVLELATQAKRSLSELAAGDSFQPIDTFEIVAKKGRSSLVRNSAGFVCLMSNDIRVGRSSDLARSPNGYTESKVALAAFPVAHVVSHRTLRVNHVKGRGGDDGFITAFVGDAQASPHFMRYSGLTGACINCMSFNNLVAQALQGVSFEDRIQRYSFETNWSNGEVVQRGTGTNYGANGFLRPSFPHRKLVDYVYGRVAEHYDIGADTEAVVTRDWKVKLAAGLVPRGLELDGLFHEALMAQLELALHSKFVDEVKLAIGQKELPPVLAMAIEKEMNAIARNRNHAGSGIGEEIAPEHGRVVTETGLRIASVLIGLKQTIDFAVEMRSGNTRLDSEAFNQPKPVDSIIDDFAVEAQNIANALAESAAFSAATIALQLQPSSAARIASALLGLWNISIAFNTITNVARYRNRNQEARRKICDEKMVGIKKAVFSLMTRDQRNRFIPEENPFIKGLNKLVAVFVEKAWYYNVLEAKIVSFEQAYSRVKSEDDSSTLAFMRQLVQEFIPGTFHDNAYLQDELVGIYKALDEMLSLTMQAPANGVTGADELYRRLLSFHPDLSASIERGPIIFGFLREHAWYQTPVPTTLRFIFGPLLVRSVPNRTYGILKAAEAMKNAGGAEKTLSRPVRDLHELHRATKESEVASMVMVSSFTVFCFSVFFTIFRLIQFAGPHDSSNGESDYAWVRDVVQGAAWASIGSELGAILAIFHFAKKQRILFGLDIALGRMKSDPRIRRALSVTRTQEFFVFVRLLVSIAASVALPWSVAIATNLSKESDIPIIFATVASAAAALASFLFLLLEFILRYNLDPCIGVAVCEPFRARIDEIKNSFTKPDSVTAIETPQQLERDAWEYTARQFLNEYRFDTVFAADRFGTVFQQLQSGNKKSQ